MIASGTSSLVRWTCSACGATTLSANERNVSWTISISSSRCRRPGVSARADRNSGSRYVSSNGRASRRASGSAPHRCSRPARRVSRSCTVSAAYAHVKRASTSPRVPYSRSGACRGRGGGGVGDVVGEHLIGVGTAGRGEPPRRGADHAVGEVDCVRRRGQIGDSVLSHVRRTIQTGARWFRTNGAASVGPWTSGSVSSAGRTSGRSPRSSSRRRTSEVRSRSETSASSTAAVASD